MEADRFVQRLPDYLTCPVCFESAWKPVELCPAQHIVCNACFLNLAATAGSGLTCPVCRVPFPASSVKFSQALTRALDSLPIRCKDGRCGWRGTISQEEKHRTSQCSYRLVKCKDCCANYALQDKSLHLDTCPSAFIVCCRGGPDCGGVVGNGLFMRKDKNEHDQRCASYRCNVTAGCNTRTTLKNRPAHELRCAAASRKLADLEAELKLIKARLAKTDVELVRTKDDKKQLEKQVEALSGVKAVKHDEHGRRLPVPIVPRYPPSFSSSASPAHDAPSQQFYTVDSGNRLFQSAMASSLSSLSNDSSSPSYSKKQKDTKKLSPKKKKQKSNNNSVIDLTELDDAEPSPDEDDDDLFLPPPDSLLHPPAAGSSFTPRQHLPPPPPPSSSSKRLGDFEMFDPDWYDGRGSGRKKRRSGT